MTLFEITILSSNELNFSIESEEFVELHSTTLQVVCNEGTIS